MKLSAVIIAKNEAAVIGRCVSSVLWADEVVVLDSGSSDGTVEQARALGARVESSAGEPWPGFGAQKNRALDLARGEWVLSLDADEWVTPELRAEIERALSAAAGNPGSTPSAWRMPRASTFCGRRMYHSGWWPDHVTRLFRRGRARWSPDLVHEKLVLDGAVASLASPLMHEAVRDLDDALAKMTAYSSAGARMLHARGRRTTLAGAVVRGLWSFFRSYVVRRGFLDGREGFLLAVANGEGTYYRYAKLLQLQRGA